MADAMGYLLPPATRARPNSGSLAVAAIAALRILRMGEQQMQIPVAVIGAGAFGRQHARVYRELPGAELAGVYDLDPARARQVAQEFGCRAFSSLEEAAEAARAASVAVPTVSHALVGCALIQRGLDVLVEKPIAPTLAEADRLIAAACAAGRRLQVGHLERFNPAVLAARRILNRPMFFEVHRLSVFSPRSLDIDVVLDLMIHDLDIVLDFSGAAVEEVRAAGLPILSSKIDIASVRLAFDNGCIANFTASRVSTERVRKLRFFQPRQYISIDYTGQDATVFSVEGGAAGPRVSRRQLLEGEAAGALGKEEPLRAELRHFLECVETRRQPIVDGEQARRALDVALQVVAAIEAHRRRLGL
jgi:predicted dehydrogenase